MVTASAMDGTRIEPSKVAHTCPTDSGSSTWLGVSAPKTQLHAASRADVVTLPSAVLIRTDGYVGWVGHGKVTGLRDAVTYLVRITIALSGSWPPLTSQAIRRRTHQKQIPAKRNAKTIKIANSYHWKLQ